MRAQSCAARRFKTALPDPETGQVATLRISVAAARLAIPSFIPSVSSSVVFKCSTQLLKVQKEVNW